MQQYGQDYKRVRDFELPGIMRKTHRIEDCTIEAQGQTSDAVDLRGYGLIGLILPALTACNLTFTVSETEAGTYRTVYDDLGAAFTVTAGAGNRAISTDDLAPISAYRWVRVVSSESQGAERILHFIVKG
jgi:hypothetical protein